MKKRVQGVLALNPFLYICIRNMEKSGLKEHIILVDADYLDVVASVLLRDFSRMLGREIPPADLPQWLVCAALDGGISAGVGEVQVIFIRSSKKTHWESFNPSSLTSLDGQAFRDVHLGEFFLSVLPEEEINHDEPLFVQSVQALMSDKVVRTVVLVPNEARDMSLLLPLVESQSDKRVTLLGMQPPSSPACPFVMLGYSLMQAMGITSEELERKQYS